MFSGLKIIELASVLAGPSVGQFFAELGGEVIKIENAKAGGDVTRSWKLNNEVTGDRSAYFCSVNWGKRSVSLDLTIETDLQELYELVKEADIVIVSFKPGDAKKLRVDYETLKKFSPNLIYGKITGYGEDNQRVGYDAIIQAEFGFMSMNGEAGGEPLKIPVALMDILAAHQLKEALLLAIIHRLNSGEGSEVEVSLAKAAIASLANQATNYLMAGHIPRPSGSAHPNIAPYGEIYYSKDNVPFVLAVGSDNQFSTLCEFFHLKLHRLRTFATNQQRVIHRHALKGELNATFNGIIFSEIEGKLLKGNIPFGRIKNIQEVSQTTLAEEMMLIADEIKSFKTNAFKLSFYHPLSPTPPPHLH